MTWKRIFNTNSELSQNRTEKHYAILNLLLIDDAWCKLCNIWFSSARATSGVSIYWSLALEENIIARITQDEVVDDNLKRQIKNRSPKSV